MPSPNELLGLVIVIFVIWFVLKLARVAIRLILFVIAVIVIIGAFYWIFMR
jgi:mannose/fructose/N-acetylgalactosamine-specific phosphotransferase system component IID